MDYYEILGVDKDASESIIKRAYKTQVLTCHPDKVAPPERSSAEEKFKLLTEAYQVLCDPVKRADYDSSKKRMSGSSSFDIFDDFFTQRDFFNDPFSHPFFSRNTFSSNFSRNHFTNDPFSSFGNDKSSVFDSLLSSSSRQSGSFSSTSKSTIIQNGITKSITESRVGNNITREEIILNSNGQVISRTKTVNSIPVLENKKSKGYKIHIS